METSILNSTKKVLGLPPEYTAYDADVIMFINSVFAELSQLGIGPVEGFAIDGEDSKWGNLELSLAVTNMVKSFVYLKVRMLFDPPTTSFVIDAMNRQIEQMTWRLSVFREATDYVAPVYVNPYADEESVA